MTDPFPPSSPNEYTERLTSDDGWWMYAADQSRIHPQQRVVLFAWEGFTASYTEAFYLRNGCNRNVYNRYYGAFSVDRSGVPAVETHSSTEVFLSMQDAQFYAKNRVAALARSFGLTVND